MRSRSSFGVSPKMVAAEKPRGDRVGHVGGMIDAGAERQPRTPLPAERHHLVDGRLGELRQVDCRLQVLRDELAAAGCDAADAEPRLGGLADERREVPGVDQLADGDLVGDVGEERALAFVQHAAVEAVGRCREADHLELRVDPRQVSQEAAIHGVRPARDQMRLVDQHEIGMADLACLVVDRLDAGEEDRGLNIAAAEPGRVDAGRRVGPEPDELGIVLRDQLADMGDDEDALVGPGLQHAFDEGSSHEALAAGGGDHDERVAALRLEIAVDRVDRGLLICAQGQHGAASSSRASLVHAAPSRIR